MENYYCIADLYVKMFATGKTLEQAKPYICDIKDQVDIEISPDALFKEGYDLPAKWPHLSEESRYYMGSAALFYRKLISFNGMMLHSSCVVVDGRAYLFTADSGTGKSTHTNRYLDLFNDRAFILNDDKPALRFDNGIWYAYGTPWSGKHDISVNTRAPIAGIAVLERSPVNIIERISGIEAISKIIKQVNRPKSADYRIKLMQLLDLLITNVPIWKLRCNMDPEAAIVSYEAMSGKKFKRENEK